MQVPSEDPAGVVFENYRRWKGEPTHVHHSDEIDSNVSPHFAILEYAQHEKYSVFCTLGASYQIIPESQTKFKHPRGVRYEYIMHGLSEYTDRICNLLHMVSVYPFLQNTFFFSGFVLPLGIDEVIIEGSNLKYLYFTFPYKDDPRIYNPPSWGEIKLSKFLIQTLWIFPIYRSEAEYIRKVGLDDFENLCYEMNLQAHDFFRQPLV